MGHTLMFTGDVNLMNVIDPAAPFARVADTLARADCVFGNLECCLHTPAGERSLMDEGFYAAPAAGGALTRAGYRVMGTANNVNYGSEAILSSLAELDRRGILHAGSGANREAAYAPAIVECNGLTIGFLQRTSVYWPTNHEAGPHTPGVAALRGHTAYQLPLHKTRPEIPPGNRPGVPPEIRTWADPVYLAQYREDVAALKRRADIVVASHHWGLFEEVLEYMTEVAHAAIDAGADVVVGHGPHFSLPIGFYRGRPIFYGLGSFSFHTGHGGRKHGNWLGMLATVGLNADATAKTSFRLVRHNERNETVFTAPDDESEALARLADRSAPLGARLEFAGGEIIARPAG
jgi:poly-gamma-glutamate capsule biosynthesis protein CapA/YwtB (metallophosphatase superfamily)